MNEKIRELLIQSEVFNKDGTVLKDVTGYELNKFADLVRQDEREACAVVCESLALDDDYYTHFYVEAIRARGEK